MTRTKSTMRRRRLARGAVPGGAAARPAAVGRPTPKATRRADISPLIDERLQAADGGKSSVRSAMEAQDRDLIPLLAKA